MSAGASPGTGPGLAAAAAACGDRERALARVADALLAWSCCRAVAVRLDGDEAGPRFTALRGHATGLERVEVVAVLAGGVRVATLTLGCGAVRPLAPDDLEALRAEAPLLGEVLRRIGAEEALARSEAARLRAVAALARAVGGVGRAAAAAAILVSP